MKHFGLSARIAVLATATLFATGETALAADRTETVKFAAGASNATVKGAIKGYDGIVYRLDAGAGQVMQVLFDPSSRSCYFNVATPDGEGNLLDNSLILYGSSISDGNLHTHHDLPIVLAGGGGGQVKGNRHLRFPKETPLNNLLLSMVNKAGVPVEKFGDSTGTMDCLASV